MREMLADVISMSAPLFEDLQFHGSAEQSLVRAATATPTFFMTATLTAPEPSLSGETGLGQLGRLAGLLDHSSFRSDEATFNVVRWPDRNAIRQFAFRAKDGTKAVHQCKDPKLCPQVPIIKSIPWDVRFTPQKAKLAELQKLASLSEDKNFTPHVVDGVLMFDLGDDGDASHLTSVVFETGINGALRPAAIYPIQQFLSVLKLAGSKETRVGIYGPGVIGIDVTTEHATYQYVMRGEVKR